MQLCASACTIPGRSTSIAFTQSKLSSHQSEKMPGIPLKPSHKAGFSAVSWSWSPLRETWKIDWMDSENTYSKRLYLLQQNSIVRNLQEIPPGNTRKEEFSGSPSVTQRAKL